MDRIEGAQCRLHQRSRNRKQCAVERQQAERVEQRARPIQCHFERIATCAGERAADRTRNLGEDELARDEISAVNVSPERSGFGFLGDKLHERRRVDVEERHSAFATNLVESAAERPGIAFESNRLGQPTADGAGYEPLSDQSVKPGARQRRRPEFGHGTIPVRDDQPFTTLDPAEIDTEVLPELRDAYRLAHVHQSSISDDRGSERGTDLSPFRSDSNSGERAIGACNDTDPARARTAKSAPAALLDAAADTVERVARCLRRLRSRT